MENYFRKRYENWAKFDIQRRKVIVEMVGFVNETCQYYVQRLKKRTIKMGKNVSFQFNNKDTDGTVYAKENIPEVKNTTGVNTLILLADALLGSTLNGKNDELKIIAKKYDKR